MGVLIFLFFLILIWGSFTYNPHIKNSRKNAKFLIGAFIPMWYVHSMVNPNSLKDLPTYQEIFLSLRGGSWGEVANHWSHGVGDFNIELGYLYLNKIIGLLTSSFTVYLWLFSFFMLYAYFKCIKEYSPNLLLSILILLLMPFGQSLFVIRQHMAIALMFASIPFIINRRLIPFLLLFAITFFSFHHSCIAFLPMYFLYGLSGKKLIWVLAISMGLIVSFWSALVVISFYLDYGWFAQTSDVGTANVTTFIQFLLFFLLFIFTLGKEVFVDGLNKLCFCVLAIAVFLNFMSVGANFGRLTLYFNIFAILSVPLSLKYIRNKQIRGLVGFSIILLLFVMLVYGSAGNEYKTLELLPLW